MKSLIVSQTFKVHVIILVWSLNEVHGYREVQNNRDIFKSSDNFGKNCQRGALQFMLSNIYILYNACSVHYTNKIYLTLIVLPFIQAKPILTDFFASVEYTSRYYTFFGKVCLRFFCFYLGGGVGGCFCEEGIKGSWTPPLQSFCLLQCAMSLCFFSKTLNS